MVTDFDDNEDEEEYEIEVTEISLTEDEIGYLIENLKKVKESKKEFTFELDDENELLIKYQDDGDEEWEGDEEEENLEDDEVEEVEE